MENCRKPCWETLPRWSISENNMKKGFTLIELLVVVGAIVLLVGVIVSSINSYICKKEPNGADCEKVDNQQGGASDTILK